MKTNELIDEAAMLPVEERARLIDSLLRSFNPPESDIDRQWAEVARHRLEELRSGQQVAISGEKVFDRAWARLNK
ncbi:MAG: addiction module protein [Saccharospirillum sp.]